MSFKRYKKDVKVMEDFYWQYVCVCVGNDDLER